MYNLERVQKEFREACLKAKAYEGFDVPIKLNGRLTRTLGRVRYCYDDLEDRYTSTLVEFSKQFLETATDESIHDVILHEAAHLIVTERTGEMHGHDALFKSVCLEIGTTNYHPETEVERTVPEEKIYKYSIFCPTCQEIIGGYSRMCPTIRHINECSCKRCGNGGLEVITNW